ncbi:3-keto-disaccharide hydrolase [Oceaniferula spumae]
MKTTQLLHTGLYLTGFMLTGIAQVFAEPTDKKENSWVDLLEGDSLAQWRNGSVNLQKKVLEIGPQWSVKDGVLLLDKDKKGRGGQIVTKKNYFNFELKFEFKISEGGNSGVKYRTKGSLGMEYQILDDQKAKDNKNPKNSLASLYQLVAAPADKKAFAPGTEWNKGRIVANGNTIEHWLNGQKVVSIEVDSADWKERFAVSKYKKYKDFARNPGPILLQDHGDTVSYRKIMVREFK